MVTGNEIVLTLNGSGSDQSVDIFKQLTNGLATLYRATLSSGDIATGGAVTVTYNSGQTYTTASALFTMEAIVDDLNTFFTENGVGVFSYSGFNLLGVTTSYVFEEVNGAGWKGSVTFLEIGSTYLPSTTVTVTMETGSISYEELLNEFISGRYYLVDVDIFSESITQSNRSIQMIKQKALGNKYVNLTDVKLDPMKKQFVTLKNRLGILVDTISYLTYTVEQGETVKMIFRYKEADIWKFGKHQDVVAEKIDETMKQRVQDTKNSHQNPMMKLVNKKFPSKKKLKIAEIVGKYKGSESFTNEEIWNGFNDEDVVDHE